MASKLGIDAAEQDIKPDKLSQAEEAFLTNSLMEIMPLTEVEGKPISSGKPEAITKRLMEAYKEMVSQSE